MLNTYILSVWSFLLDKTDAFFLPCPFKSLTGLDCPGCGFQRSFVALLKGDFHDSFYLYPPTVPLLLTFVIILPAKYFTDKDLSLLIKTMFVITGAIILINYLYKMIYAHHH